MGSRLPYLTILHAVSRSILWFALAIMVPGLSEAESSPQEPTPMEEPTPHAGREYRTKLFGEEIYVAPRDRRSVTAASFGLQWKKYRDVQIDRLNGTRGSYNHLQTFAQGDLSIFNNATCLEIGSGAGRFTDYLVGDDLIYANDAMTRLDPRLGYGGSSAPSLDEN